MMALFDYLLAVPCLYSVFITDLEEKITGRVTQLTDGRSGRLELTALVHVQAEQ